MLLAGFVLRTSQLYVFESLMFFDINLKPVGKGQINLRGQTVVSYTTITP